MRTLKFASMLTCCALAVNAFAQDEGRSGRQGSNQQGTSGSGSGSGQSGTSGSGQSEAGGATAGQSGTTTRSETTTTQEGRSGRRGGAFGGQGRAGMQGGMAGMQVQDRDFAVLLSIGNQAEIEMGNFVKGKTQNDQVKQFADHMIMDHTAFLQQLGQVASRGGQGGAGAAGSASAHGGVGSTTGATTGGSGTGATGGSSTSAGGIASQSPGASGTGSSSTGASGHALGSTGAGGAQVAAAGRAFYSPGMNPMLSIKQEIGQECLAQERRELEQKQGAELDKAYVGSQVVKHLEMLAQLTVAQRHAQDSQFKEMLGQGLQKTQQHLEMAKNLKRQLDQQQQRSQ